MQSVSEPSGVIIDPYAQLLDKRTLATKLGVSRRSVEKLMQRRVIPYIRVGAIVRFRLADVERALSRYQVKEVSL
jgi:excisionase family DNA binding protein